MDILKDIKEIMIKNKDKEHHIRVEVSGFGIYVYLEYDPGAIFDEKCIIPIKYDISDGFAYISNDEYRKMYNPEDYGIDLIEISIIKEIMGYLESHSKEINELCEGYIWNERNQL